LVERGRLHEGLEIFKIRTIGLDGFLFAASQECREQPGGMGIGVYRCRGNGDGDVKLLVRFFRVIAGRFEHVGNS
jgi:hypothetical protein